MAGRNMRSLGAGKEELARDFLLGQGFQILTMNFRTRFGEIDIVARETEPGGRKVLVFTEVKYRETGKAGTPLEAVDYRKQRRISRTALYYMMKHSVPEGTPIRFDCIGIDGNGKIRLLRNAFDFTG